MLPLAGGSPSTLASGVKDAQQIALDTTSVYWSELATILCKGGTCAPGDEGAIMRVAKRQ
jgi:hypothetical protein